MVNISRTEISMASRSLLILLSVCLLAYFKSPAVAFLLGAAIALIINGPLVAGIDKLGVYSLQAAIVLLGLKLNAGQVMAIAADYSLMVAAYVILTMGVGLLLGRILRNGKKSAQLISSGSRNMRWYCRCNSLSCDWRQGRAYRYRSHTDFFT